MCRRNVTHCNAVRCNRVMPNPRKNQCRSVMMMDSFFGRPLPTVKYQREAMTKTVVSVGVVTLQALAAHGICDLSTANPVAVFAALFGLVQGTVSQTKQGIWLGGVVGVKTHTNAGPYLCTLSVDIKGTSDRLQ